MAMHRAIELTVGCPGYFPVLAPLLVRRACCPCPVPKQDRAKIKPLSATGRESLRRWIDRRASTGLGQSPPLVVDLAGISNQPNGAWMTQIARNLTDCLDGFLRGKRYLILDRDPLYTRVFRSTLAASGVKVVRLPSRSPNLNAFSERFVLSVKSECLDRVIPLGERHLRHLRAEYVAHYHTERNHQSLGNELIEPIPANTNAGGGVVRRRARLGGLLSYYYREAA